MLADWPAVQVSVVILVATVVRSAFGFGEALVAVPLLALLVPVNIAGPVAVLASILIALITLTQDWREVHIRSAGWLVLSTLFGVPLGLLLLRDAAEAIVKSILGALIVAFSIFSLVSHRDHKLKDDSWAWLFGFSAGVLGGAYGMNGPPLVVYGSLRRWSPGHFRATLQGYFLLASIAGMAGYWIAGLWTPAVSRYFLFSLPSVFVGTLAGRMLNRRMDAGMPTAVNPGCPVAG